MGQLVKSWKRCAGIIILALILAGCSRAGADEQEPSADMEQNISVFDGGGYTEGMMLPTLMGEHLYYWTGEWDRESRRWYDVSIYRRAGGEQDAVEILSLGDRALLYFTVDEQGNLYCLYGVYGGEPAQAEASGAEDAVPEDTVPGNAGMALSLRKDSPDGSVVYDILVPVEAAAQIREDVEQNGYITQGTVASSGELLVRGMGGSLYLFDDRGEFLCAGMDGWDGEQYQGMDRGLVNAGEAGIYTYAATGGEAAEGRILLSRISVADAAPGAVEEVELETTASLAVYSGYDRGILVSDGDSLWEYRPAGKECKTLLDWGDPGVDLKNYDIDNISILEDGRYYAMVTGKGTREMELVYIETRASSEIAEKQTVTIGSFELIHEGEASQLEVMIKEFNKYNKEYQLEFVHYESAQDLYLELLKGDGPDAFQLTDSYVLASKGVLEDLSPYFAQSQVVRESDLLPSVREAGMQEGKLVSVFTQFYLNGLIAGQEATDNGAWTPEEFFEEGEQHPEALITPYISNFMVMDFAIKPDLDSFIDWQDRKCSFDSGRFIHLLESVRRATDGKQEDVTEIDSNFCRRLHDGEILTDRFRIGDVWRYMEYKDAYDGFASFAGYPNSSGSPYFYFELDCMLAMNSASDKKEGVWKFMEYVLSENYQRQRAIQAAKQTINGQFPVRRDAFDAYLTALFEEWNRRVEHWSSEGTQTMNNVSRQNWGTYPVAGEEDRQQLLYMVENAHWSSGNQVERILYEEAGSFFAGDKTAEEAARIIQNRVQLYLDEM